MPSSVAISPKAVRRAILIALDEHASTPTGRPLTIDSIAADLLCSRSTLQRQLFLAGTTYSVQLRKVRALVAVKAIMGGGQRDCGRAPSRPLLRPLAQAAPRRVWDRSGRPPTLQRDQADPRSLDPAPRRVRDPALPKAAARLVAAPWRASGGIRRRRVTRPMGMAGVQNGCPHPPDWQRCRVAPRPRQNRGPMRGSRRARSTLWRPPRPPR